MAISAIVVQVGSASAFQLHPRNKRSPARRLPSGPRPTAHAQVVVKVRDQGLRPKVPAGCSGHVAAVMEQCWAETPSDRPTFLELQDRSVRASVRPCVCVCACVRACVLVCAM